MNIQKLVEQHINNYPCTDESVLAYRRQHMSMLEDYENRKQESNGAKELAAEIANIIKKILE